MPAGFPKSIVSTAAWTGADFENGPGLERYTLRLDEAQITELEQACQTFKGKFPENQRDNLRVYPLLDGS